MFELDFLFEIGQKLISNVASKRYAKKMHIVQEKKWRTIDGTQPLMEYGLWWKAIFGRRQPSVEGDIHWKTTVGGTRPLVEVDLWWKTTFSGRQPSAEDNLQWKATFSGRWPSVEDNQWWKTTIGGRLPLVEDNLRCDSSPWGSQHNWAQIEIIISCLNQK